MNTNQRMRPVIILPPGEITKEDIAILRENGMCVVEAKDPSKVRFVEPPPLGYSVQERAAIALCRWVMGHDNPGANWSRRELAAKLADFFCEGSPLEPLPRIAPAKK